MENPFFSIVVPLYNEALVFNALIARLLKVMDMGDKPIQVVMIDDGSTDTTAALMKDLSARDGRFKSIILSRNFGHQPAVSCGLDHAEASHAIMIIDGDLQDPPELLFDFYKKMEEGIDVVYAIRKSRKGSVLKVISYWLYYRVQKKLTNFDIPLDSGDFCLMSRKVKDHIIAMPEKERYLRGMRSWVGFKQYGFPYERDERKHGESKYSYLRLFRLALTGIFNFSEIPIKTIIYLGFFSITIGLIYFFYLLYLTFSGIELPKGYTSLYFAITFFSGVQLFSIGIIGEYLFRTFDQVRSRPLYIVDKIIN
jgi:glycosyltransferase involved in cell wall biosynthesis